LHNASVSFLRSSELLWRSFFFVAPTWILKNFLGLLLFISTLWIWWLTDLVLLMESLQ
jgi:hypothetical protein